MQARNKKFLIFKLEQEATWNLPLQAKAKSKSPENVIEV